jgi:hypothetical protein
MSLMHRGCYGSTTSTIIVAWAMIVGLQKPIISRYQERFMHTITFGWGRHHKCVYGLLCPHQPEELSTNLKWKEAVLCTCSFTAIRKRKNNNASCI